VAVGSVLVELSSPPIPGGVDKFEGIAVAYSTTGQLGKRSIICLHLVTGLDLKEPGVSFDLNNVAI
jgi:hypothetical protein